MCSGVGRCVCGMMSYQIVDTGMQGEKQTKTKRGKGDIDAQEFI